MRRVLIVEDDSTLLEVLRLAFTQSGWETWTAQSLSQALERLAEAAPDVVLTDKNLPGGDFAAAQAGVELVRRIRQRDREVGVVLMTAYGTAESARDTLNLGIDEYLEKPFDNLFVVVERLGGLAERVAQRRHSSSSASAAGLTVVVAAGAARQAPIARALGGHHRVLFVENPEAIRPSARSEHADVVILDGPSYPEITCLVVEIKTRARGAACVVLSEELPLTDIKRLIELEVKALIDQPLGSDRFAEELRAAVERLRGSR